jgi:dGTPase
LVQELGQEGYEGNAQTFRILVRLSIGDTIPESLDVSFLPGLNQTRASLNAVLKYPWFCSENPQSEKKWGCYETERAVFEWARAGSKRFTRSVEAEIMDWADDITYAIHDMTDFHCANLIPLHLLCPEPPSELNGRETDAFFKDAFARRPEMLIKSDAYKKAFNEALRFANIPGPYQGTQSENRDLWAYSSVLITKYMDAIALVDPDQNDGKCVQINENAKHQTSILKELTWKYVILHNELATIQFGQRTVIRDLFGIFERAARDGKFNLFPVGFRQLITINPNVHSARWAADYISGMTEREVARVHHKLTNV